MPLWIFRISAIFGMPFLVYIFISQDYPNIMLALLCGLIIVAAEHFVRSIKFISMMVGIFGAIAGYTIYVLCDYTVSKMNILDISNYWDAYKTVFAGVLTVLGGLISIGRVSELEGINKKGHHIKIVDMSALLDGRIVDLCETGFFEGTIVLPQFVIDKLNSLISSKDPLEKARGRRGLDTITRLKELKVIPVKITSRNRKEGNDIENLLSITQYFNGKLITTDFNVNKAAVLKDIPILNISDLTTALKPIVLPGESMSVFIMKEGKESSQGIGYLDDGTMVVIEEGRKWIGKRTEVFVSSILQTSTGRMIFSKMKQYQD